MANELENNFGRNLLGLVTHLIKNAKKVPEPVLQGAFAIEDFSWAKLDNAAKLARLEKIAELTAAPSEVHRHFEAYPHKFSKACYARYLTALKLYQESLGG